MDYIINTISIASLALGMIFICISIYYIKPIIRRIWERSMSNHLSLIELRCQLTDLNDRISRLESEKQKGKDE